MFLLLLLSIERKTIGFCPVQLLHLLFDPVGEVRNLSIHARNTLRGATNAPGCDAGQNTLRKLPGVLTAYHRAAGVTLG